MENKEIRFFDLPAGSAVLIYGAGAMGVRVYNQIKNFYRVCAFLDRHAEEMQGREIPVCTAADFCAENEAEEYTVLVCVHNGDWHAEIAETLSLHGFGRIVFLALHDMYELKYSSRMNEIYCCLLEERWDLLKGIPHYSVMKHKKYDECFIRKGDTYVAAYCTRELLYVNREALEHEREQVSDELIRYQNCPIAAFRPHRELFRYFMGEAGDVELFIDAVKDVINLRRTLSREEILEENYKVYQLLERELAKGTERLAYAPLDVSWNPGGYFNVVDGHHRAVFYSLKNISHIPVRMKRWEYEEWKNSSAVPAVIKVIENFEVKFTTPVSNPHFIREECQRELHGISVLELIQEYVYSHNLIPESLLEVDSYNSYFARNFYRMGTKKIVSLERSRGGFEMAKALNRLQYIPEDRVCILEGSMESLEQHFEMGVFCDAFNCEELEEVCRHIDRVIETYMIWQSKDDAEKEKEFIITHTQFSDYMRIGAVCAGGFQREIGIFTKKRCGRGQNDESAL